MGICLLSDGSECFRARLNIQLQMADELSIHTIERNGGTFTASYLDRKSLEVAVSPTKWIKSGKPLPSRKLPPLSLFGYYSCPRNRGYLADPDLIHQYRINVAKVIASQNLFKFRIFS